MSLHMGAGGNSVRRPMKVLTEPATRSGRGGWRSIPDYARAVRLGEAEKALGGDWSRPTAGCANFVFLCFVTCVHLFPQCTFPCSSRLQSEPSERNRRFSTLTPWAQTVDYKRVKVWKYTHE
ncbi:hypothetical protein FKM82_000883 [Ascaphus truei]